jgi:hypothetical protein
MAQKFLRKTLKGVGAAGSAFSAVPAGKVWIILGCNIANASGTGQQTGRLTYNDGVNEIEIVPSPAQVPVGGSLLGSGGDGKDVLIPGDVVKVYVATGTGDVWLSYMEVDQA